MESLFIQIEQNGKKIIVGTIYKPPYVNKEIFIEKLSIISHAICTLNIPVFLCGDFNIDLLNAESSSFINSLNSYFLIPLISKPTRITDTSQSLIDNIFVNLPSLCHSGIIFSDISDHLPIFIICKDLFENPIISEEYIKYRLMNDDNISDICAILENTDFNYFDDCQDIDETFNKFYDQIFTAYSTSCPIKVRKFSYKRLIKPWINSELLVDIKQRQRYFIQYKKGVISKQYFTRFRNDLTNRIRVAKLRYYDRKFDEYKSDSQKSWSLINNLIRPFNKSRNLLDEIRFENVKISNNQEKSEIFNKYFCSIGENIASNVQAHGEHLKYLRGNFINSFFLNPTNPQEVFSTINNLKPKSNNNINSIPPCVLKATNYIICHPLSKLINLSFSLGKFPRLLKMANVIPIPKQGDLTLIENFRPISLLNIFSKVFEKIVYKRLINYLDTNKILFHNQFGFRAGKSTSDALVTNLIELYEQLDKGNAVFSMFLDFRKAFDCVDPQILISKLKYYGVRGVASQWFESFLKDRLQCTTINGVRSGVRKVSYGVPQGSTLGPLMFLVFINDLPNASNMFQCTLFADDCTLTTSFRNIPLNYSQVANNINSELNLLSEWFQENKIMVNYNKTKFIIFTLGKYIDFPCIHIQNHIIHQTELIRFLGVIFDFNLNFKEHLKYITNKISKWLGILFKLKCFLPTPILLRIYKSFIHPYILYGLEVWYGSYQYIGEKIFILQKKALRCIYKLPYNDHTSHYFKISRILKVFDLYKHNMIIISYKMFNFRMYESLRMKLVQHSEFHSYNTRGRNSFVVPLFRTARLSKSILVLGTRILNDFSIIIFESKTLRVCKRKSQDYLMLTY